MSQRDKTYEERLIEKTLIVEGGCWLWQGTKNGDGYGRFRYKGILHGAHRVSYMLYKGEIPMGMCVLHSCDTPACINPKHLKLGTQIENIQDMENKGRAVHPLNTRVKDKVTPEIYQEICTLKSQGLSQSKIANIVGISQSYIGKLLKYGYERKSLSFIGKGNGRVRKIDRDTCKEMQVLRGKGLTYSAIAEYFNVSETTAVRLTKYGYDYKQPRYGGK